MQEVQAICDRVLIINKGKAVANEKIDALQSIVSNTLKIAVEFKEKTTAALLQKIPGVESAENISGGEWELSVEEKGDVREAIFKFAVNNNLTLLAMQKQVRSVENVFQELTRD